MEIAPRKCLVTGAAGVVGVPLVNELLRAGHLVRVLARSSLSSNLFDGPVEVVRGDVRDAAAVDEAASGVSWIFHLAAKLHVNEPGAELADEYTSINVRGTGKLLDAAAELGAEKFIFFSTINAYGPGSPGTVFDETNDPAPMGPYAESKVEAEKLVLACRDSRGANFGVVLRLAAVYGSRMKGNYVRLAEAIRRGRFLLIGSGENRRTLVHQSDAARAAILAAEKAHGGSVYNVTDGSVHTLNEIAAAISSVYGQRPPGMRIPVGPVRLGIAAAEGLAKAVRMTPPVSRALLDKFLEDIAVDGGKIQRELGFQPQFDLALGWREALTLGNDQKRF